MGDHLLQRGHIHPVHLAAKQLLDLFHGGLEQLLRLLVIFRLGGHAQFAFPLLGVGSEGGVAHFVHLLAQLGLHGRLPDAEQLQGVGGNDSFGQPHQVGLGPIVEHGSALAGRAGQHDDMHTLRLKGAAGGGAPVVFQHGTPLGQHGLLKIVFRHGAFGALKVAADALGRRFMEHQLLAKGLCQHIFGQVVAGRAKTAGGDDDVRPALGQRYRLPGTVGVIPHHRVPVDIQPQLAQSLRKHLRVRIGDAAQQQFRSHGQNFYRMGHDYPSNCKISFTAFRSRMS